MGKALQTLRSSLRRIDPVTVSYLGVLGIPSYFAESLEPLRIFMLFWLLGLWPLVSVLIPTSDEKSPVEFDTDWRWRGRFLASNLLVMVNPFIFVQSMGQIVGNVVALFRYRGQPPAPERFDQQTDLTLPFSGTWTVVNGGVEKEDSHSWSIVSQRYAYDFVISDEDRRTHDGDGDSADDYFCYGEPMLAPADGIVVETKDGHRDSPYFRGMLDPFQRDIRGNYVTIQHAEDEYSVLAHLAEGSVAVEEGERVEQGQQIGRCGHSGNSTEPHLHFQLQDQQDFFSSAGLPITFSNLEIEDDETGADEQNDRTSIREGQRVTATESTNSEISKRQM
ncbi:Peptidase family M23 [Haladaptatus litoreus]|uniref:Peptidase family M23 n=1 Tax=Haladaptatus litoreus TaxID=553468 RepID=A0A1N6UM62_9EURY|nr:M23 family metallopeptidase [Haladaptatus litoreus]SIQ66728.1 Peptidase family M23 [Haladaptatus litoreus]